MTLVLLTVTALAALSCYLRLKPRIREVGSFLPDSFLFGIGLYTAGALIVSVQFPGPDSLAIATISLVAMVSAIIGATFFALVCRSFYQDVRFTGEYATIDSGPLEKQVINVVLLISAIVCLAFVFAVFSNSIVGALLSIASLSGESTLLDARKAITAGSEGYFAPGYVKQFRDILIPIALIATMSVTPTYRRSPVVWFAFVSAILAMLVSGQRLVFVVLFVALLIGRHYTSRTGPAAGIAAERRRRIPWTTLLLLIAFYAVLTVLLGRANADLSPLGLIVDIFINLADRVFLAAPRENFLTFSVWQSLGPTYGESWLADLGGVLPGVKESLANVLHSATGGSLQGNSPLGLPADVWLAWGWGGLAAVPFLYAFGIGLLDMVLLTNRSALFFATRIYLFVVLPICYSPYLFVLYGGVAALILILFAATLRSKSWWRISTSAA